MKMTTKKTSALLLILAAALCVTVTPVKAASKAKLSKKSATLCVGETLQLKVTGGSGKLSFSASKKKVAAVSKDGLVTAKKTGTCDIKVKKGSAKLKCKVTVKALPKGYATVNGKKVKVGGTVKITYKMESKKPIGLISVKYRYDKKGLELTSSEKDRFKVWVCNESIPDYTGDKKPCELYHLCGVDPKDPYNYADITCKKAKVIDSMKLKVLKAGNYNMDADFYMVTDKASKTVKGYKITTIVK